VAAAELIRELDASSPGDVEAARELFREYADGVGVDLGFQDFERELAELPAGYVPPGGALLLAEREGVAVGCVGVRAAPRRAACEMKRLYVRASARGDGLGRRLAAAAIATGRRLGYEEMLLDTLPSMAAAHALYEQLGFRETGAYRFNPVAGTRYLALDLRSDAG
jgi:GNAT superfamily N-acetyltransferase